MRARLAWLLVLISTVAAGAPQRHTIAFGKWTTVKWFPGASQGPVVDIQLRPLYVDGRLREYTLGEPHDVTDRVFVVQQAYRLNDALPGERGPQWKWQRGGWLMVERATGRVRPLSLPGFDPFNSLARWYRDYAAYCGFSEKDGKRYAVVVQLGRRTPLLRQELAAAPAAEMGCSAPAWQRDPARVTFSSAGEKRTFEVRGHTADPAPETDDEPKAEEQP
jgi:hypothetical protein